MNPEDAARYCDLLLTQGESLIQAGESLRASEEMATEALELAEGLGDDGRAFRAALLGSRGIYLSGYSAALADPRFVKWARLVEKYAGSSVHDRVEVVRVSRRAAIGTGRWGEGYRSWEQLLALAKEQGEPELMITIAGMAGAPIPPRFERDRLAFVNDAVDWPTQLSSDLDVSRLKHQLGYVFLQWGDRGRADELWGESLRLKDRESDALVTDYRLSIPLDLAVIDGRLEEVVEHCLQRIRAAEGSDPLGWTREHLMQVGFRAFSYLGRGEEVLSILDQQAAQWRRESHENQAIRVVVLAYLGRMDASRAASEDLMSTLTIDSSDGQVCTEILCHLLEAAVLTRDRHVAETLLLLLEPIESASTAHFNHATPARHLGGAAHLLDEPERSRRYYGTALETAGKIGNRPEVALSHLGLAELLLAHYSDEAAEARQHLDTANSEFRAMNMHQDASWTLGARLCAPT